MQQIIILLLLLILVILLMASLITRRKCNNGTFKTYTTHNNRYKNASDNYYVNIPSTMTYTVSDNYVNVPSTVTYTTFDTVTGIEWIRNEYTGENGQQGIMEMPTNNQFQIIPRNYTHPEMKDEATGNSISRYEILRGQNAI